MQEPNTRDHGAVASILTASHPPEYVQDDEDIAPLSACSGFGGPYTSSSLTEGPSNSGQRHSRQLSLLSRPHPRWVGREPPPPEGRKVFTYDIPKKGQTWAELKVASDALMSKNLPTIIEGSRLEGEVKLNATRAEAIKSVIVSAKGQVITGTRASERLTFFENTQTVWSRSMGNPQGPTGCRDSALLPYTGKLQGSYTWSYSIEIPKQVIIALGAKGELRMFKLPESFWERHARASIRYEVCVRFVRGYFRPDDRIHAAFCYIPLTIPEPPSPLRQLAYWKGTPVLGPDDDPDGWWGCKTVRAKGRLHQRDVEIQCTLSLAKPLTYTRGSVISCWLTLYSHDAQALDEVASPSAVVLRLRRCVKAAVGQLKSVEKRAWRDQTEHSELGIWWPVKESTYERELSGELHLMMDLAPSSAMAHFCIEYSVVLFPFDTQALGSGDTGPLIEQPVDIVTGYAPGPRPRMYTPPEYESPDGVAMDAFYETNIVM